MRTLRDRIRSFAGWSSLSLGAEQLSTPLERQRAERVLALARVFFAASSLVVVALDPTQLQHSSFGYALLTMYLGAAVALWLALLGTGVPSARFQMWIHASDLLWATLLTAVTEAPNGLFFLFFLFVLLAAASRWGFQETILTAAIAVALLTLEAAATKAATAGAAGVVFGGADVRRLLLRSAYVLIVGSLLGYLVEEEQQRRAETATIARIVAKIRTEASLWSTFDTVAADVLELFRANSVLLLFEELQSGRTFLWSARGKPGGALRVAASEIGAADADRYRFDRPGNAWCASSRVSSNPVPAKDIVAVDRDGRRIDARPLALPADWIADYSIDSTLGVTVAFSDIGSGIVLLFGTRPAALLQLRFLQRLANQLAPAMYSVYLLRRVRSRVGALERARIARELHDGIIQSLIGLEMQVEALRRSPRDVAQVIEGLAKIQQHLASETRDVRDLMHELEPTDFAPSRLLERLQELVDRFQRETGIAAQFVSDVDEVTLAPPVCHELARITQEALVNVRKHSGAHHVVVRFTSEAGCPKLIIDNDGRGLGFTGRLSQAELDAQRKGPVVIKERVHAMGADLAVESSERGVRLEITLPPRTIVRHKTP